MEAARIFRNFLAVLFTFGALFAAVVDCVGKWLPLSIFYANVWLACALFPVKQRLKFLFSLLNDNFVVYPKHFAKFTKL